MPGARDSCDSCGRQRWQDDRFCAQCGAEFEPGPDGSKRVALEADDQVRTAPGASVSADSSTAWHKGGGALTAAVALLVGGLLVGGLYLTSSSNEAAPAEDVDESRASTPTPAASTADATAAQSAATAEPTPRPTRAPDPITLTRAGFLADVFGDHDPGARWLLIDEPQGKTAAYDLHSGERFAGVSGSGAFDQNVALDDGYIAFRFSSEGGLSPSFVPWDTGLETVELNGSYVGAFMDRDVGRVLVSLVRRSVASSEAPAALAAFAFAVESGELREIPLELSLLENGLTSLRFDISPAASEQAPAFISMAGGMAWGWRWTDGWAHIADGDVEDTGQEFLLVRACLNPARCDFSVVDFDGEVVVDAIAGPRADWYALSPDGETLVSVKLVADDPYSGHGEFAFALSDVSSGETSFNGATVGLPQFSWSPNSRYLVATDNEWTTVFDVERSSLVGSYEAARGRFRGLNFTNDFIPPVDS